MEENLIKFFGGNIIAGDGSRKGREVVVELHEMGIKQLKMELARFTHCTVNCAPLLGKDVNRKKNPE